MGLSLAYHGGGTTQHTIFQKDFFRVAFSFSSWFSRRISSGGQPVVLRVKCPWLIQGFGRCLSRRAGLPSMDSVAKKLGLFILAKNLAPLSAYLRLLFDGLGSLSVGTIIK
jgi:hypothetical protein